MKRIKRMGQLCLYLILLSNLSKAQDNDTSQGVTTYSFGGYIKTDFLSTWYHNGDVGSESPLRDFHLPSQIPVGPVDDNFNLDFHVKESRFNFDVTTKVLDKEVHGFLEMDFLLSKQGDEKVSNSFNPRLRHFYVEWNRLLIGQTWSSFMVVVVPDDLDFSGAFDGLVFVRQPQIRYKAGNWWFAIENPETTVIGYQQDVVTVTEKEVMPDFVIRRNFSGDWGSWSVSGIYRTLSGKDLQDNLKRTTGYGITTGGKIHIGNGGDDIRIVGTYGNGLGRYLAGNFISAGVIDQNNDITAIGSLNGYIAWNHYWIKEKLSSSFNVAGFQALNDANLVGATANNIAYSYSGNLKYHPAKQLMLGGEFMTGYRELEDGTGGSFNRLQFSVRYLFGYQNTEAYEKF